VCHRLFKASRLGLFHSDEDSSQDITTQEIAICI